MWADRDLTVTHRRAGAIGSDWGVYVEHLWSIPSCIEDSIFGTAETGVGESERRITEKVAKYGGIYWWCLEDCDCDGAMPDPDACEHKRKPDIYVKCSFARRVFTGLSLWQRRSRERTGV